MPFATFASAKPPGYVGFKEGDIYVWDTEFDEKPVEEWYEDIGYIDKDTIEIIAKNYIEWYDWELDVTQWKLIIHDIRKEDDDYIVIPSDSIADEYNYVKFVYTLKEYDADAGWWRKMENYQRGYLIEPDEEYWAKRLCDFWDGIYFLSKGDHNYPALVVPKNLDWDEVARWMEKPLTPREEDEGYYRAKEIKIQHFLDKKQVGLYTERHFGDVYPAFEKELDTFETIYKYNEDGILYYYEYTYDGDIIAKFELKEMFGYYTYIYENWWWLSLIAGAMVVGIIILIVVIIKLKKRK